jgi:hypothetical protein
MLSQADPNLDISGIQEMPHCCNRSSRQLMNNVIITRGVLCGSGLIRSNLLFSKKKDPFLGL